MNYQLNNTAEGEGTASAKAELPRAGQQTGERALKIVCFQFDPNICGPHVRARSVYRRMTSDGHAIRIVIPAGPGTAEGFYRDAGVAADRLPIRKPVSPSSKWDFALYFLSLPVGIARVFAYFRRERPDLVYVNGAYCRREM